MQRRLPPGAKTNRRGGCVTAHEKLQYLLDFYRSAFAVRLYIVCDREQTGFEDIAGIRGWLEDELKYRIFWLDKNEAWGVWVVDSFIDAEAAVNFGQYLISSRRLLNCLRIGDFPEAYRTLETILEESFHRDRRYMQSNIYQLYGLISMISATMELYSNERDRPFFDSLHFEEKLYGAKNMYQLLDISRELFEQMIAYFEEREKGGLASWLEDAVEYILKNYADMNLGAAMLAERAGVSTSHLSRSFKEIMGTGVLDYIHKIRLEHARELLDGGVGIEEAAVSCGYLDAKALRRVFKRYEGITPGQYRDIKKGEEASHEGQA